MHCYCVWMRVGVLLCVAVVAVECTVLCYCGLLRLVACRATLWFGVCVCVC